MTDLGKAEKLAKYTESLADAVYNFLKEKSDDI